MTTVGVTGRAFSGPGLLAALSAEAPVGTATLWWLGQSGFAIRYREELALIDPYLSDSLTTKYAATATPHVRIAPAVIEPVVLGGAPITLLFATHHHTDHMDPETLRPIVTARRTAGALPAFAAPEAWRALAAERSGMSSSEVIGMDAGTTRRVGSFEISGIPAAHERIERDDGGHVKCLGYVLRLGGRTVYHSGDTLVYDGLAEALRPFAIDVALLPINGKVGNMTGAAAAGLAAAAGVRLVVPCHYGMFEFNTADPAAAFVPECRRIGQAHRVLARWEGQ